MWAWPNLKRFWSWDDPNETTHEILTVRQHDANFLFKIESQHNSFYLLKVDNRSAFVSKLDVATCADALADGTERQKDGAARISRQYINMIIIINDFCRISWEATTVTWWHAHYGTISWTKAKGKCTMKTKFLDIWLIKYQEGCQKLSTLYKNKKGIMK